MKLPKFSLPASNGRIYTEVDFSDGIIILYLYPRDMTPTCTTEAQNFRDARSEFAKLGIRIFGLSSDSVSSHEKFCTQEALNFVLISDEKKKLIKTLKALKEKNLYGKIYWGTERSTFIIQNGEIIKEWRNVDTTYHIKEVLKFCKTLS